MRDIQARRLEPFGTTVFSVMSQLAVEHQAINLGQGFPDFPGPEKVKQAAIAAINADLNQYAPSHGLPILRSAIAETFRQRCGRAVDPDSEVTVTTGATEAMLASLLGIVNPGDEVILFEPFYDAYPAQVVFAGGIPRYVRLHEPDWTLDVEELQAAISLRTRAIVINTPNNPTGKVFSHAELEVIAQLCREHDIVAITDEVYDRIIYDDASHISIANLPDMWERTITINSTGKTFGMTGWKIGYTIASERLTQAIRASHQFITFATATPFQAAMAEVLTSSLTDGYYSELARMYASLRNQLRDALVDVGFTVLPCHGSYFLLTEIEQFGFASDVEFCRFLTTEIGVAAIPPSAFYADPASAPPLARFCFAKRPETIEKAAERLQRLMELRRV